MKSLISEIKKNFDNVNNRLFTPEQDVSKLVERGKIDYAN